MRRKGRSWFPVNLVTPAGPIEIRQRQADQQIAQWCWIKNVRVEDHANARPAGGLAAAPGPGRALLIRWRFGSKPLPLACRKPRTSAAAATARTTFCAAPPSASSVMAAPGSTSPLTPPGQANLGPARAFTPSMPMPLAWPRCLSMLLRGHRDRPETSGPGAGLILAVRLMVLDVPGAAGEAESARLHSFYASMGFRPLPGGPERLLLAMSALPPL